MIRTLSAVAISAATALFATSALAQDPPAPAPVQPVGTPGSAGAAAQTSADTSSDGSGVSAAVLLGYGFNDAFKLGFGARVGYTLPMHLYLGGTFVYHLGTSTDIGNGQSITTNVMMIGAEVGYEIPAGPVMIRPNVGLGIGIVKSSVPAVNVAGFGTVGGGSASASDFFIAPGATLLYPVTGSFSVGVDARFIIISDANAFAAYLTAQYHF